MSSCFGAGNFGFHPLAIAIIFGVPKLNNLIFPSEKWS